MIGPVVFHRSHIFPMEVQTALEELYQLLIASQKGGKEGTNVVGEVLPRLSLLALSRVPFFHSNLHTLMLNPRLTLYHVCSQEFWPRIQKYGIYHDHNPTMTAWLAGVTFELFGKILNFGTKSKFFCFVLLIMC